jgi:glycosyltransferase involved in cell wall biosynthesis
MRLLVLSNFYPPARAGGYTQWCHEVSTRLAARGHTLGVLTSCYRRAAAPAHEPNIFRRLHLEGDLEYYQPLRFFAGWRARHRQNLQALAQTVQAFAPDLVFVWGMWAMSKALPARAEQLLPGRVVYYLSDYWPALTDMHTDYWQLPARRPIMRAPKQLVGWLALSLLAAERAPAPRFEHALCVSARVRELLVEAGVPVQRAEIVRGGTDVERFNGAHDRGGHPGRLRLVYAGQLVPHKGVHTAIEALARLAGRDETAAVELAVVGAGHPAYEASLRAQVEREGLQASVTFHPPVSRDEMPALLARFDALLLPSIYEEPLARIAQEAMAAGLVVIGTPTGGTPELLTEGVTGLTFAPEDAEGLARQVGRLLAEPELRWRLARAGRDLVRSCFTLDRMVDEIERYLFRCCPQPSPA